MRVWLLILIVFEIMGCSPKSNPSHSEFSEAQKIDLQGVWILTSIKKGDLITLADENGELIQYEKQNPNPLKFKHFYQFEKETVISLSVSTEANKKHQKQGTYAVRANRLQINFNESVSVQNLSQSDPNHITLESSDALTTLTYQRSDETQMQNSLNNLFQEKSTFYLTVGSNKKPLKIEISDDYNFIYCGQSLQGTLTVQMKDKNSSEEDPHFISFQFSDWKWISRIEKQRSFRFSSSEKSQKFTNDPAALVNHQVMFRSIASDSLTGEQTITSQDPSQCQGTGRFKSASSQLTLKWSCQGLSQNAKIKGEVSCKLMDH